MVTRRHSTVVPLSARPRELALLDALERQAHEMAERDLGESAPHPFPEDWYRRRLHHACRELTAEHGELFGETERSYFVDSYRSRLHVLNLQRELGRSIPPLQRCPVCNASLARIVGRGADVVICPECDRDVLDEVVDELHP